MAGSPDLYQGRTSSASVNFITAHDGFTLYDLVSYNDKHNEANGEGNGDGANDNNSWNCGEEGPTASEHVRALRMKQMKNLMAILLTSQGVPMFVAGDEVGRTQLGNNNTYCQDNELSWFDWGLVDSNAELLEFTKSLIAFRHAHPVLRNSMHPIGADQVGSGYPDISWHGVRAWAPDWSSHCRVLALMRCGKHAKGGTVADDHVYIAINSHWEGHDLELPRLPEGLKWRLFADTSAAGAHPLGQEPPLEQPDSYHLGAHSVVVLVGR
ncbi:pullulanase/glycogen debranching enzyme [Streptomyces sp. SAI-170]|uniref:hypothetical protein n=1 Tax=Streptomyces sp. SAI-170 TaxID=3377729 RepID=UPI003C7C0456